MLYPICLSGPGHLGEGLRLILRPGLRLFVPLPLLINLLLFVALIALATRQFGGWVESLMPSLPAWLSFLEYLLWPLFVALVLLIMFFSFTLLARSDRRAVQRLWPRKSSRWCAATTARRRSTGASCWR